MKSFATIAVALFCVLSADAAPSRKRNQVQHKSTSNGRVAADESYDPYLGMDGKRNLAGHGGSMSMSMPEEAAEVDAKSGAFTAGVSVSALAAAGAMMLL